MDIESLELNLLKSSQINDGDIILVKIDETKKSKLKKEDIQFLYEQIKKITKKDISIYFFPENLSLHLIKNHIKNIEESKAKILKTDEDEKNKEPNN